MTKLSIVLPCYYEELNVKIAYETIKREVMDKRVDIDYEIIFVNDGSTDNTLEEIKKVIEIDHRCKGVNFSRNFGEFRADIAGLEVATGDCAAVISCDMQDPPALILDMLKSWEEGNKVNICTRVSRDEPFIKNFFANTYYKCVKKWAIPEYPKGGFDFFLIDKEVKDKLVSMQEKNSSIYLQLVWLGYNPKYIEYNRMDRERGESNWSYLKRINLFIDTFIVFSKEPVRFISKFGVLSVIVGFIILCLGLFKYLEPHIVVIAVLFVLIGAVLIAIGVVGEYIWRIMHEVQKRPLYVIDEIIEAKKEN